MPHTRAGNILRQTSLMPLEKEVIQSCLLGDGTLSKSGKHCRLRIEHERRHQAYVQWKWKFLKRLCISDIQKIVSHQSVRFGAVGHPEITQLRRIWYRPQKTIPSDCSGDTIDGCDMVYG